MDISLHLVNWVNIRHFDVPEMIDFLKFPREKWQLRKRIVFKFGDSWLQRCTKFLVDIPNSHLCTTDLVYATSLDLFHVFFPKIQLDYPSLVQKLEAYL